VSTPTVSARGTPRLLRALGLSRSQAGVRALLFASAVALVALTLVAAPHALVVAAVVLVVLAGWAAWRPESAGAGLLVVGLALHWLSTVPVPVSTAAWLLLLAAAVLLLVVHLTAALAASLPPAAGVPVGSLRRWTRRGVTVATTTIPLWALSFIAARGSVPGEVSLTYAAIAGTAVLALAVWLLSREPRR
jgi:hypothetical protein